MLPLRHARLRARSTLPPLRVHRHLATRPPPPPTASPSAPLFDIPPSPPRDFPPIAQRLKPLIPFLVGWCAITSLALHLLRARKDNAEEMARADAQVSVLEGLVERARRGELEEGEARREMEMVGLRRREGGQDVIDRDAENVGWWEVLLGRRRGRKTDEEQEEAARAEWAAVVNAATAQLEAPPDAQKLKPRTAVEQPRLQAESQQVQTPRRAPSASVYAM